MATIGSLVIDMRADVASLRTDFAKARREASTAAGQISKSLENISKTARLVGNTIKIAITGAAIGALAQLPSAARTVTRELDSLADTANKLGVGVEQLQELRYAAFETGVAQNTLDLALQRFVRRLGEARQGAGELKGTLDLYNIAIRNSDGTSRDAVEVLKDYADTIARIKDPAEQLRVAFKGFDSEGAALVNTLRDGRKGLEDFAQRARDLGVVLEKDLVEEAAELNKRWERMALVLGTKVKRAILGIIELFDGDNTPAAKIRKLQNDLVGLEQLRDNLTSSTKPVAEFGVSGFFQDENLRGTRVLSVSKQIKEKEEEIRKIQKLEEDVRKKFEKIDTPLPVDSEAASSAQKKREAIQSTIQGLQFEFEQLKRNEEQREIYNQLRAASVDLASQEGQKIQQLVVSIQSEQKAIDLREKGIAVTQSLRTEEEKRRDELKELSSLYESGAISAETYARGQEKIKNSSNSLVEVVDQLGFTFSSAFEDAIVNGERFSNVLDGILKDILRITVRSTITEPFAAAAKSAVAGVDIGSFFGFANGGIMAPGGPVSLPKYASGGISRTPAIFGEAGPEAAVPLPDGRRIPVDLRGGGGALVQIIDQRSSGQKVEVQRSRGPDGQEILRALIRDTVTQDIGRNGNIAQSMQNTFSLQRNLGAR